MSRTLLLCVFGILSSCDGAVKNEPLASRIGSRGASPVAPATSPVSGSSARYTGGPRAWKVRCEARIESARRELGKSWELFAGARTLLTPDGVLLEATPPGGEDHVPSERSRFVVVVRDGEDGSIEHAWQQDVWSAASVHHWTRVHHGRFARIESGFARADEDRLLVAGFRSTLDACLEDGPSAD